MPRPIRKRRIHRIPSFNSFGPLDRKSELEPIRMSLEEYETIRLIDKRGFTQEECSRHMDIARTTVQQLYNDARYKVSLSIVDGRQLIIEGGNYLLCEGEEGPGYGRRRGRGGGRGNGFGPLRR